VNEPGERWRVERDDLLARVDLESLLDALTGPSDGGRWHCPDRDHPDVHPSVTVTVGSDGIQRWRCWSGGHRGTAIDAVAAAHRIPVGEAMRWLADRYGSWPTIDRAARPPSPRAGEPHRCVIAYVQRAERLLWTSAGEPQRRWLAERGLGEEVLRVNRVGADPGRRFLPRPRGFPTGRPAVVYPALSPGGTVAYFQARYLDPPPGRSRYDNPARVHATSPRVAWLHPPHDAAADVLMVTEGVGDGLVAAQAGLPTVAVLGCQYPDAHLADTIEITRDRSPRLWSATVVVCFDGDDAGRHGAERLAALFDQRRVPHRVLAPPEGVDLSAWAATDPGWIGHLAPPRNPSLADAPLASPGRGLGIAGPR
jgi:DNA primase